MKYTHILELKEGSPGQPNQYRITVVEDTPSALLNYHVLNNETADFKILGYYDEPEDLLKILEPYLAMENSK